MAHRQMFNADDPMLSRVRDIALRFPEADEKVSYGRPAFFTKKVFAYYGASLKVDGAWVEHAQAIAFVPAADERLALEADPRSFVPAYIGKAGWLGLDLTDDVDIEEVAELLEDSYRATAPARLVSLL